MKIVRRAVTAFAFIVPFLPAAAQDYRVRLDARAQSVSFRGLLTDSIPATEAVQGPTGGSETADGRAVRCVANGYCFFLRPGDVLHAVPVTTVANLMMWGFGVEGLSLRATGRFIADLGGDDVWPGSSPSAQLIEGLLEYRRSAVIVRAGRQLLSSRLESMGFDGAWLKYRFDRASLDFTAYGGWGLGQAATITAQSPALNPLDEWRPRKRQIVAGAEAGWLFHSVDLRGEYRREIDPEDDYFVSERAALSFASPVKSLRLNGGFDYNIAEGRFGSADATVTYPHRRYSVSLGARRYRPYFSLWTLWGAFSPVPYNAINLSAQVRPSPWLSLHGRGERYSYESADVSTALVPNLADRGWRTRIGATALRSRWTFEGNYGIEHGPGAAARSADAQISFAPNEQFVFDVYGGTLARPLELRFYDATARWIGARFQWQPTDQRRFWSDVAVIGDDRERPDSGGSSLDQFRVRAGISLTFGSAADRTPLPPARPLQR